MEKSIEILRKETRRLLFSIVLEVQANAENKIHIKISGEKSSCCLRTLWLST